MGDFLLDLLGSLLGLGGGEQPPAQSRPRPLNRRASADPGQAQPAPPQRQQKKTPTLEDLLKQMLGVPDEKPVRPPPRALPREEAQHRVRPPKKAAAREQERPQPVPAIIPGPAPAAAAPVPEPAPVAAPAHETPAFAFLADLRADNGAARRAFVHSEIFGKPLADRSPF